MPRSRIDRSGAHPRLTIDGTPVILTAGELANSASTGARWRAPIWPRLKAMNLTCVLAAVPWDMIEPQEGRFDFALIDALVAEARAHGLKLIPLWFGTWKNGLSHYAPLWVKRDTARFFRARIAEGATECISPLCTAAWDADAAAFAALMGRIAGIDHDATVPMVQVQNEVGLFGALRDHSAEASAAFAAPVPQALLDALDAAPDLLPETRAMRAAPGAQPRGTWAQVFPGQGANGQPHADEAFMAWHFARYVEHVAAAGRAAHDVPLFVNAALDSPVPNTTGYFQGGPVAHMADIWRAAAPSIDMIAPDIYQPDFAGILDSFARGGNPLFVPESLSDEAGAANALFTIGRGGIGYAPFAVETTTDPDGPLPPTYALLNRLAPRIAQAHRAGTLTGLRVSPTQPEYRARFGGHTWIATRLTDWRSPEPSNACGGCLILQEAPDTFLIAGHGIDLRALPDQPGRIAGIGSLDDLVWDGAEFVPDRRLSGDEIMQSYDIARHMRAGLNGTAIKLIDGPRLLRATLYTYPT